MLYENGLRSYTYRPHCMKYVSLETMAKRSFENKNGIFCGSCNQYYSGAWKCCPGTYSAVPTTVSVHDQNLLPLSNTKQQKNWEHNMALNTECRSHWAPVKLQHNEYKTYMVHKMNKWQKTASYAWHHCHHTINSEKVMNLEVKIPPPPILCSNDRPYKTRISIEVYKWETRIAICRSVQSNKYNTSPTLG